MLKQQVIETKEFTIFKARENVYQILQDYKLILECYNAVKFRVV